MRATTAYGVGTIRAPSTRQRFDPALGTTVVRRGTVPAATLATAATLTVLVGAWGGIVPFVGATMSYSADGSGSWHWDLSHVLLWLIPGALAVVLGLLMLGIVPRVLRGAGRFMPAWAGLLTALCGAWFVLGPFAWGTFEHAATVFRAATPLQEFAYLAGWSLGPGLALALLGGCTVGVALRGRPAVVVGNVPQSTVTPQVAQPVVEAGEAPGTEVEEAPPS
jgi:hypothetical protein